MPERSRWGPAPSAPAPSKEAVRTFFTAIKIKESSGATISRVGDRHPPLFRVQDGPVAVVGSSEVGHYSNTDEVIDAQRVADLLGLGQRHTVFSYPRRYLAMPRPAADLGDGRSKLWLRTDIEVGRTARGDRNPR
jgi:hypothetical protein